MGEEIDDIISRAKSTSNFSTSDSESSGLEEPNQEQISVPVDAEEALTTRIEQSSAEVLSADKFISRLSATDSKGDAIQYPNTWELTNGNPEENWQAILIYLEDRYGNQKNKTIKQQPYPEDISNLSYLFELYPDRLAAQVWVNKLKSNGVIKQKLTQKKTGSSTEDNNVAEASDEILLDKSFKSTSNENTTTIESNRSIDDLSPVELLQLAKANKLLLEDIENIKSRYHQESDKEKQLILHKIIQLSGKNLVIKF